jgi:hypothetical protein
VLFQVSREFEGPLENPTTMPGSRRLRSGHRARKRACRTEFPSNFRVIHKSEYGAGLGEGDGRTITTFLRSLASTGLIVPSWAPSHPAPDVLKRIINSRFAAPKRLVFATDLREAAKSVIGQRATQLARPSGHIVVRVSPGGQSYRVFVLENQDEQDLIAATLGPFHTN